MNDKNSITIEEAIKLKAKLDRQIFDLVNHFQTTTGLDVASIELKPLYHPHNTKPFITEVETKIIIK